MARKVVRLTLDHLEQLTAPCRTCLFWQLDPVRRARVEDPADELDAWVSRVLRDWGSCGRVVLVDGVPTGFAIYAPEAFLPGAAVFPTAPVSPDAVLLTTVYVAPHARRGGLGRMLVQGMARDLIERGGIRAVEAFGDTRGGGRGRPGPLLGGHLLGNRSGERCVLSVDFLGSVGFKTHRPHPLTPRMRMDLRSALSWRDEVEAALERLLGAVRPSPRPRPTTERRGQSSRNSESSLSRAALGRAPTMERTTSPPW